MPKPKRNRLVGELLVIGLAAIAGMVIVEIVAILHGINGVALSTCMATLGSIAGFALKRR